MKKGHLYVLAGLLTAVGISLAAYKIVVLDFPLFPGVRTSLWSIEAHLTFDGNNAPIKIAMLIPRTSDRLSITNENFVARGT